MRRWNCSATQNGFFNCVTRSQIPSTRHRYFRGEVTSQGRFRDVSVRLRDYQGMEKICAFAESAVPGMNPPIVHRSIPNAIAKQIKIDGGRDLGNRCTHPKTHTALPVAKAAHPMEGLKKMCYSERIPNAWCRSYEDGRFEQQNR